MYHLLAEVDLALMCDFCDQWTHYNCIKGRKAEFERLKAKDTWFCSSTCKKNYNAVNPILCEFIKKQELILNEVKQSCAEIKTQMVESNNDIKTQIQDLTKNIDYHNKKYEDFKVEVMELKAEVKEECIKVIKDLQVKNKNFSLDVINIKTKLNIMHQEKLMCKAICFGVPLMPSSTVVNKLLFTNKLPNIGKWHSELSSH